MKLNLLITLLLFTTGNLLAQITPDSYHFNKERKSLSKINSSNPISNSILDVIAIGDFDVNTNLVLRDVHKHLFEEESFIIVTSFGKDILIQSQKTAVFILNSANKDSIVLPASNIICFLA